MWKLEHGNYLCGIGWFYSKPTVMTYPDGYSTTVNMGHFFPARPTNKQLRKARNNKLH